MSETRAEPKAVRLSDEELKLIQEADLKTGRYISGVELHRYQLIGHAKAISAELADLLAVAKAYEAWEGKLLLTDAAWISSLPRFTQELLDEFMEIQALRNAAVKKATTPKGPTP